MTTQPKPRYPAALFKKLRKYPIRHCQLETCGKQLTPRITDGKLEAQIAELQKELAGCA